MHLTLYAKDFLAAAGRAFNAAEKPGGPRPALSCLLLAAEPGRCTLAATDLEVGRTAAVAGVTVHEGGRCLLPADHLLKFLRLFDEPELRLDADDRSVRLASPTSALDFEIPAADPDAFPPVPSADGGGGEPCHEADAASLLAALRRTSYAMAAEAQRYSMTGVAFECDEPEPGCRLVATDGRRLACAPFSAGSRGGHRAGRGAPPVVPAKAVPMLERLAADAAKAGESVRVSLRPNEALFAAGGETLYTRLVEGRYPDWRHVSVGPLAAPPALSLDAATLARRVEQARLACDPEGQRVTFGLAAGRLTLQARGEAAGTARVEVGCDYAGPDLTVNLNPKFVLDALKPYGEGEQSEWLVTAPGDPCVFRAGDGSWCVVMPLT